MVEMHDFPTELGKVSPHGVYDLTRNEAMVTVGTDHDTAAFAVHSIKGRSSRTMPRRGSRPCRGPNGGRGEGTQGTQGAARGRAPSTAPFRVDRSLRRVRALCSNPPPSAPWRDAAMPRPLSR